jgi:RNA polymerase sigma-70 factor, ECF subfamily
LATEPHAAQPPGDECVSDDLARLVRQFCLGDRAALAPLVRIWEHRLLVIAFRVVGNLHDAEEVRQIVLLKLARSAPKLDDPARFAGWLRRCVVNEAVTWLRRRGAEARRRETFDDAGADGSPTPPQRALAAERSQRLQQALARLEPESRALLSLRFDEGMTIRQVAEVLERPPMTVHGQIARALGRLREQLGVDHEEKGEP